jgi:hypothetical protein
LLLLLNDKCSEYGKANNAGRPAVILSTLKIKKLPYNSP